MYRRASEPGSAYCPSVNAAGNDVSGAARWVAMCLLRVSRPSVYNRRIAWVVLNATRPDRLRGVRKAQSGGDGGDLQGAPFGPSVAGCASVVPDGDLAPGQGSESGVQVRLVPLHR